MKIRRLGSSGKGYGGNIYESYIDRAFASEADYEVLNYQFRLRGIFRLLEFPFFMFFCWRCSRNDDFFLIRNFNTSFFPLKKKKQGLTIIYHIDETGSRWLVKWFQKILEWLFFLRRDFDEPIVVISEYWKKFLQDKGYRDLHLIYCPFEIEKYQVSEDQVEKFCQKYDLRSKNFIYLGNPQFKKGYSLAASRLGSLNYALVTSGEGQVQPPIRHLKLQFEEYLCLLKASCLVVTMSLFKEGWCRVAHEALLMGVPVIGSGAGGLSELLQKGGGRICTDFEDLETQVRGMLQSSFQAQQEYLKSFTVDRFDLEWKQLLKGYS